MIKHLSKIRGLAEDIARGALQEPSFEKYAVEKAKQLLSLLPPPCPKCGGSGEVPDPNVISMGPPPKIPCPSCQPAGEVERFLEETQGLIAHIKSCLKLSGIEANLLKALEQACTHITALLKRCEELQNGQGVLQKIIAQLEGEKRGLEETIKTRGIIIGELNQRLRDIGGQC